VPQEKVKQSLENHIRSNQHEFFVISIDQMDEIISSSTEQKNGSINTSWKSLKRKTELGASYSASADDIRTLSKLVSDLGGFGTKAYIKTYGSTPHIILKGYPGLRRVLTSPKYGVNNPKVITMGLGKAGAIHAAKSGGILTIVLMTTFRVADYILTDEATLSQLIGSLATDVVKVAAATGASIGAASLLVAAGVTLAIGPIVAVIIVGTGVSMTLNALDNKYNITKRIIAGLDDTESSLQSYINKTKLNLQKQLNDTTSSIIDYTIDESKKIFINIAKHQLDHFLSSNTRVY